MLVDSNKKSNQDIITQSENQRVNSTGVIISQVLQSDLDRSTGLDSRLAT